MLEAADALSACNTERVREDAEATMTAFACHNPTSALGKRVWPRAVKLAHAKIHREQACEKEWHIHNAWDSSQLLQLGRERLLQQLLGEALLALH
jgi:hypothetical protein